MKTINLEYSDIPLLLPPINYFLDKIKNNTTFHFIRINHGGLDKIGYGYIDSPKDSIYEEMASDDSKKEDLCKLFESHLKNKQYSEISHKIISCFLGSKVLTRWHGDYLVDENLKVKLDSYIQTWIKVLLEYKKLSTKFDIGISTGIGLHTAWGIHEETHPLQEIRQRIAKILLNQSNNQYFYSGILKHYAIKKEIFELFELLNKKDFNVIFFGPKDNRLYKDAFKINKFFHIEIPTTECLKSFEYYTDKIINIAKNGRKTIVLHSCGHILSGQIAYKLKDTDIYGIDIGRSFDIIIKEYVYTEPTLDSYWIDFDYTELGLHVTRLRKNAKDL